MNNTNEISQHCQWFENYAKQKIAESFNDSSPLELKLEHTWHVLDNAGKIIINEKPAPDLARACLLAALYHDIARFDQYLKYKTFRDKDSCNHGLRGVKIIKAEKLLQDEKPEIRKMALAGVGLHNRFALPSSLSDKQYFVCNVVRDSDKLDILRVMDAHLSSPGSYNPTVVLGLPDSSELYSEKVVKAALDGHIAAYDDLVCVNDFRTLLGSWFFDMHFSGSKKIFVSDGHACSLLEKLPQDEHYGAVRATLLARLKVFANNVSY